MTATQASSAKKHAVIHRMVMEKHICPYGLKAKVDLPRESGELF